jgi:hypothetical protein
LENFDRGIASFLEIFDPGPGAFQKFSKRGLGDPEKI